MSVGNARAAPGQLGLSLPDWSRGPSDCRLSNNLGGLKHVYIHEMHYLLSRVVLFTAHPSERFPLSGLVSLGWIAHRVGSLTTREAWRPQTETHLVCLESMRLHMRKIPDRSPIRQDSPSGEGHR